jgi:hypothetical protein
MVNKNSALVRRLIFFTQPPIARTVFFFASNRRVSPPKAASKSPYRGRYTYTRIEMNTSAPTNIDVLIAQKAMELNWWDAGRYALRQCSRCFKNNRGKGWRFRDDLCPKETAPAQGRTEAVFTQLCQRGYARHGSDCDLKFCFRAAYFGVPRGYRPVGTGLFQRLSGLI